MSKGYVIALLKLTNQERFVEDYATKVPAIIEEFGGRIVARTPNAHFREGKEFSLHVVVEFDDFEKGKEMMNSEEFKSIQEFRHANTDKDHSSFMLIEGGDTIS